MIIIIDYGLGNVFSVLGAIQKLGYEGKISSDIDEIKNADKLILPGVGAFSDGMKNLKELGLIDVLTQEVVINKKPILGICLGCQLLFEESFEFGHHKGLGWIKGKVIKLNPSDENLRVPHVGWDELVQIKENILFDNVAKDSLFYYTHSYKIVCANTHDTAGICNYGEEVVSVVQHNNVYGTQFHPEKSQLAGLTLLKNFLEKG